MCFITDGDQCKPNPCQHGGTCKDMIGGYICKCAETYTGQNCENGKACISVGFHESTCVQHHRACSIHPSPWKCTLSFTFMQMFPNALLEALWFVNTTADLYRNPTDASALEDTIFTAMAGAVYPRVCNTHILSKVEADLLVSPFFF